MTVSTQVQHRDPQNSLTTEMSRPRKRGAYRNVAVYIVLLGPALLGLALVVAYPLVATIRGSLYSEVFTPVGPRAEFVGWDNYAGLVGDPAFWRSFRITLIFNAVTTPLQIACSLALAVIISSRLRGSRIYQGIFAIPLVISLPVACILWQVLLSPAGGLVNSLLSSAGITPQAFLEDPGQALWVISFIASWKGVPYWMLFILAGLQNVNPHTAEAATLDGAGRLRVFWHVTLPTLRRPLLFVTVANTVANFFLFAPQYLLTHGGPAGSTETLMFRLYEAAFTESDFGSAYAMATILFLVAGICTAGIFYIMRDREPA